MVTQMFTPFDLPKLCAWESMVDITLGQIS